MYQNRCVIIRPMSNDLSFQMWQCPQCHLRFPATTADSRASHCPSCGQATTSDVAFTSHRVPPVNTTTHSQPVTALLDNLRSLYNVGAAFRTADGAHLAHLHLCGITPTPDNPKLSKTALGAEETVAWSYHRNGRLALQQLKHTYTTIAIEGGTRAQNLYDWQKPDTPLLFVVGNELSGIDPLILAECDHVLALPMLGQKQSLNVATAFGIVAYHLQFG